MGLLPLLLLLVPVITVPGAIPGPESGEPIARRGVLPLFEDEEAPAAEYTVRVLPEILPATLVDCRGEEVPVRVVVRGRVCVVGIDTV